MKSSLSVAILISICLLEVFELRIVVAVEHRKFGGDQRPENFACNPDCPNKCDTTYDPICTYIKKQGYTEFKNMCNYVCAAECQWKIGSESI